MFSRFHDIPFLPFLVNEIGDLSQQLWWRILDASRRLFMKRCRPAEALANAGFVHGLGLEALHAFFVARLLADAQVQTRLIHRTHLDLADPRPVEPTRTEQSPVTSRRTERVSRTSDLVRDGRPGEQCLSSLDGNGRPTQGRRLLRKSRRPFFGLDSFVLRRCGKLMPTLF